MELDMMTSIMIRARARVGAAVGMRRSRRLGYYLRTICWRWTGGTAQSRFDGFSRSRWLSFFSRPHCLFSVHSFVFRSLCFICLCYPFFFLVIIIVPLMHTSSSSYFLLFHINNTVRIISCILFDTNTLELSPTAHTYEFCLLSCLLLLTAVSLSRMHADNRYQMMLSAHWSKAR